MSVDNAATYFPHNDFTSLGVLAINFPVLKAAFLGAAFSETVLDVLPGPDAGAVVYYEHFPPQADKDLALQLVQAHTGAATTDAAVQLENLGDVSTVSGTGDSAFVETFNIQTPPLIAGTYLSLVTAGYYMPAMVAATFIGVEYRVALNGGGGARVTPGTFNSAPITHLGGFMGGSMVTVTAGETLRYILRHRKLGATAAIARSVDARHSYCRVA